MGCLELILFTLGSVTGFLAGLLGIGGAIILIPMLMYFPPYFGYSIPFHQITGLTITMVFFSSLTGIINHYRAKNFCKDLTIFVGGTMLIGSFLGSIISKYILERYLIIIYAIVTAASIYMLVNPKKTNALEMDNNDSKYTEDGNSKWQLIMNTKQKLLVLLLGMIIGLISGMIGIGGAAIITPVFIYILNIPIKVCIGTSLGVILISSTAGLFGKAITGQIPWISAIFLTLGGIIGSKFGSEVSLKLNGDLLRKLLTVVLVITLLRVMKSIF